MRKLRGTPGPNAVKNALEVVGLPYRDKKLFSKYSLGMKQRLGIAGAILHDPELLILDEPTNGLDPIGIAEVRNFIKNLSVDRGKTILISSHILDELSRLATHYGFIDSGHLVKEISREELEKSCRKCMHMEVSDVQALVRVLDQKCLEYKVDSKSCVDVFGSFEVTDLVLSLEKEGCKVFSMVERDESLESYYINLMGGESHA